MIPLMIGVVGHRDVPDAEGVRVRVEVERIIRAYQEQWPNTPILVLSALAEGADQIVAEVCQAIDGVDVIAVLPMPEGDYHADFESEESVAKFNLALERSRCRVVTSDLWGSDGIDSTQFESTEARDLAYQRCARFISLHSHVLLAIWDGEDPKLPGGTADTVFHRIPGLDGLPPIETPEWPEGRPPALTIHVPVQRASRTAPAMAIDGAPSPGKSMEVGAERTWSLWQPAKSDPLCDALEEINEVLETDSIAGGEGTSMASLMNACDRLAGRYQASFRRIAASVLVLSVMALVLASLLQNIPTLLFLVATTAAVFGLGLLWWGLSRLHVKQKFQQFRVIAEGARVQQVWRDAGISRSVAEVYLPHQPEVRWIRTVLRTAWLIDLSDCRQGKDPASPSMASPAATEVVATDWLEGQMRYFSGSESSLGALRRNAKKARSLVRLGGFGVILSVLGIALAIAQSLGIVELNDAMSAAGQALWALGLGIVAASAAYSELMAYREVSRRYAQSLEIFRDGLRRMDRLARQDRDDSSNAQIRDIVEEVGAEALQETSAWFATSYDRKVRPV